MKQRISLFLVLALLVSLLSGCAALNEFLPEGWEDVLHAMLDSQQPGGTAFADMEYRRPDPDALQESYDRIFTAAGEEDLNKAVRAINEFYDQYDWFYTYLNLADIHYCADLTDSYWEAEYNYCADNSARADALLEQLYYDLAKCPLREELEGDDYFGAGFFEAYDGENTWDEAFTALLEQETALENRYYELSSLSLEYDPATEEYYTACGNDMVDLMVELIALRQEIAAYYGYESYVQFATDFYYYRDYTPELTMVYLGEIRRELVPLYARLNRDPDFYVYASYADAESTFDYVRRTAQAMGGTVWEAFQNMDRCGLYDIAYSDTKYNASFEIYLTMYGQPYILMNPEGSDYDHLIFAHEFGHFCNDYASNGCYAGIDVLEVFSQAMEYLSLCYGPAGEDLTRIKLWDSLSLMVEQSMFASFEMQMYDLTGEDLTAENLRALYDRIALEYGFDSVGYDDREFVQIPHFYTNPMYIISYVVSNDTAMQLYQMEQEKAGTGLAVFEKNLETQSDYFLAFVEEAGLESPFVPGRVKTLRETYELALG